MSLSSSSIRTLLVALGTAALVVLPVAAQVEEPAPDEQPLPDSQPSLIASLVQQFPPTVAGSNLEIITFSGQEWLAGFGGSDASGFTDYLAQVGVGLDALDSQVALASGVFINSLGVSSALTAIAICSATETGTLVEETLGLYTDDDPGPTVSEVPSAAGDLVYTGTAVGADREIRAMGKSNVVWLVDALDPAVEEIMAVIPAAPVACPPLPPV